MGFLSNLFSGKQSPERNVLPEGWKAPQDGCWDCPLGMKEKDLKTFADILKSGEVRHLTVQGCLPSYPQNFLQTLTKSLPKTPITSLNLSITDLNAELFEDSEVRDLFRTLPNTRIDTLKFKVHSVRAFLYEDLAKILPETNLTKLYLSGDYYRDEEVAPLLKNLSPKLTELNLNMNRKSGGISACISDASVEAMLPRLKDSSLKRLDLSQTNVSDKHIPELIKIVSDPKTALSSVSLYDSDVSDEMRMNMSRACRIKSRDAVLKSWQKSMPPALLNDPLPPMDDIRKEKMIPLIAKAGRLPELMARQTAAGQPLTAADLTTRGNNIPPAMAFIRRLGDFEKVFAPNLWTNVKEMQKAWDYLTSDLDKSFLDGKNGRPSFKNLKAKAAVNAVKAVLKTKER